MKRKRHTKEEFIRILRKADGEQTVEVVSDVIAGLWSHNDTASRWVACGDFNTAEKNDLVPSERTFTLMLKAGFFWTFEGVPFEKRITCPSRGRYPDACFDQAADQQRMVDVAHPHPPHEELPELVEGHRAE